jgi:hypothetical protein
LSGPGSDLTEEPALRDVEPVTLAAESFPFVLPGPSAPGASGVGDELAVAATTAAHRGFELSNGIGVVWRAELGPGGSERVMRAEPFAMRYRVIGILHESLGG